MRRNHVIGVVLGMAVGAGGMLLLAADAVPQPNVPTQRYQITSWVAGSNPAEHGAYVLDTHTGQVRVIVRTHSTAAPIDMQWER